MKMENGLHQVLIYLLTIEEHIKKHGEWAFPVYPTSQDRFKDHPPTPYIYDDRCKWEDATGKNSRNAIN